MNPIMFNGVKGFAGAMLVAALCSCAPTSGGNGNDPPAPPEDAAAAAGDDVLIPRAVAFPLANWLANPFDTDANNSPRPGDTGETDVDTDADADADTDTDTDACPPDPTGGPTGPNLLTATSFSVLAGSTVTNTGASVLTGDLGVSPGTAITGFPPGIVNGATHLADAVAGQAKIDLTAAYTEAATRSGATAVPADISGYNLVPGVYNATSSLQIVSTPLILDGEGDPNSTWIFQIGTALLVSSDAEVVLTGCADADNVFWQVGSSATIGTGATFVGTVMADQSITAQTGAVIDGRLLSRVGAVTLDTNSLEGL